MIDTMDNKPVSSLAVANELIRLGKSEGVYFTPMQLLKLVYIAHGWSYGFFDKPLIKDRIEAWKYGPVIPELYSSIKKYGGNRIDEPIANSWWNREKDNLIDEQQKVILFTFKKYAHLTGTQLSTLTHQPNTPWSNTFSYDSWGDEIPVSEIHSYYKDKYHQLVSKYEERQSQTD